MKNRETSTTFSATESAKVPFGTSLSLPSFSVSSGGDTAYDFSVFQATFFVDEEIQNLMLAAEPPGNSFTALLELPPYQAVKLLHSPEEATSVFLATDVENSPEMTNSISPNSCLNNWNTVKQEPIETNYLHNSSPVFSDPFISKSTKRKNQEEKKLQQVKSSVKKIKSVAKETDGEKLPYIHVRARRGEATDSHSIAERARREKINARMKLLQELVPGCNKISGTATVLDQIINHVQSLQLQVEFLSMKLAAVRPIIDINLDALFSSEDGSPIESNFTDIVLPVDQQVDVNTQQIDGFTSIVTLENSFLSYTSSGNSASWLTSGLKMEL